MDGIIIQLDPALLSNPDLDIRYLLPDLIIARSGGTVIDAGYDYVDSPGRAPLIQLCLEAADPEAAAKLAVEVMRTERVVGNDLSRVPVATKRDNQVHVVVHPTDFSDHFYAPSLD